jgi:ATP-dependent Clp endopeptidase proteolytic subunit ClpP
MFHQYPQLRARTKEWFKVSAKESKEGEVIGEVEILDVIDDTFGVNSSQLIASIRAMNVDRIHVAINSPGGNVFSGMGIYSALKAHKAKITTENMGLAASIASIVMMAGDEVFQRENSMMMLHKSWGITAGNAKELRDMAGVLDKIDTQLISIYSAKTKLDPSIIENYLEAETWFTASEAQEIGLAHTLEYETIKAKAAFDLSIYKNTPDILKKVTNQDLLAKAKEEEDLKRASLQKEFLRRRIELAEYL